jgi:hypothetical protein
MELRICCIASPAAPGELADAPGLAIEGVSSYRPDGDWWVARLKRTGWSVLWSEDRKFAEASRPALLAFSRRTEVDVCEVDETRLRSAAEAFRDGRSLGRIAHDGSRLDRWTLSVEGAPPDCFGAVRRAREKTQRRDEGMEDLLLEIPPDVVAHLHGFSHRENCRARDFERLHILRAPGAPARKRGFLDMSRRFAIRLARRLWPPVRRTGRCRTRGKHPDSAPCTGDPYRLAPTTVLP